MAGQKKESAGSRDRSTGFSEDERKAMKERAQETKAASRRSKAADDEAAVLGKIGEMSKADKAIAARLHEIVTETAPDLKPKLWYGMPAYAREGKVVCFFQNRDKFKTRYATLGFSDEARLDDGSMWPASYALTELSSADERRVAELIKRAMP